MSKKYKIVNHKLRLHFFILTFIVIATLSLSIGYASINSIILDIDGESGANTQSGIFITDAVYKKSSNEENVSSSVNNFYQAMLNSTIVLDDEDPNSYVTYEVTIYNSTNCDYVFEKVEYGENFYDNDGIEFELNGLEELVTPIASGEFLTFELTFKYKDNTIPASSMLNSILDFKFTIFANITTAQENLNVYHLELENNFDVSVINNSNTAVTINLSVNNEVVSDDVDIDGNETESVNIQLADSFLRSARLGAEYPVSVNLVGDSTDYTYIATTDTNVIVVPTITNFDLRNRTSSDKKVAGTDGNPFVVHKAEDLIRLSLIVNGQGQMNGTTRSRYAFPSKNIILDQSINFALESNYYNPHNEKFGDVNNTGNSEAIYEQMQTGTGFYSIGQASTHGDDTSTKWYFKGNFDGLNNTISNLYINSQTDVRRIGLFAYIQDSTIQNLNVAGIFNVKGDAGAIAGYTAGTCNILNCTSSVNITNSVPGSSGGYYSVGGIIGTISKDSVTTLNNCINYGTIQNNASTAGLVGLVLASTVIIDECSNEGNITSLWINQTANNVNFNTAGLVVKDSSGGGTITITNSNNKGIITGRYRVAGLVTRSYGTLTIEDSYNSGTINGYQWVAGILAIQDKGTATIRRVYNTGQINGNSAATSNIGTASDYCGQIVGQFAGGTHTLNSVISPMSLSEEFSDVQTLSLEGETEEMLEENDLLLESIYEFMKTLEFIERLGDSFKEDTNGKNNGYPILTWE